MSFMPTQTNESKIQYVMMAVACSRPDAEKYLSENKWDVVMAVLEYRADNRKIGYVKIDG